MKKTKKVVRVRNSSGMARKAAKSSKKEVPMFGCSSCNFKSTEKVAKFCMKCGSPMEAVVKKAKPSKVEVQELKKSKDGKYRFPRELSKEELAHKDTIAAIEEKTAEFGCPGKVTAVKAGPIVTQYTFSPDKFIRVRRIRDLHEDLAMHLFVDNVTVQRIPGEAAVAIMIPNVVRKEITYQSSLQNVIAARHTMELPLNLGVDSLGNPVILDLAKLPHLLIAGSTGSGKSVCVNAILTSLLYLKSSKELQLALIDPKSVELAPYAGLPHVKYPMASTVHAALDLLDRLDQEMRRRMHFLSIKHCRDIGELNAKLPADQRLPRLIVIIDELADLVLQEKKLITNALAALSSVARASGIHIIAITQRPSVDVLSGKIKVNFPARVAFRVTSAADSKTILTVKGAEQLMQCGDAYLMDPRKPGLTRVHAPFIKPADIQRMMDLSLSIGHVHKAPIEATKEEQEELVGQLYDKQAAEEKAEETSIVDAIPSKGLVN